MKSLLCICYCFAPEVLPTAIRSSQILNRLQEDWEIHVLTNTENTTAQENLYVHHVPNRLSNLLSSTFTKLHLGFVLEALAWPDSVVFWIPSALKQALAVRNQHSIDGLVVFMMPYGAGLFGILLKKLWKLPLILNLDDSPTCTDMHPYFSNYLYYRLASWLENFYVQEADQIIYVSSRNMERVKQRQPLINQDKFNLIRYGVDSRFFKVPLPLTVEPDFRILYLGGMSGWYEYFHRSEEIGWLRKFYRWVRTLGQYHLVELDQRSSTPAFIGQAIQQVQMNQPGLHSKIKLEVHGNRYPQAAIDHFLENTNLQEVVKVFGSVSNEQAIQLATHADLLFMTLPMRKDNSSGGRISAKTYEYLMTDRPILAALPKGENWNYLEDKPGVWLVEPMDIQGMANVIQELVRAKEKNKPYRFDRTHLRKQLDYTHLTQEFSNILSKVISQ